MYQWDDNDEEVLGVRDHLSRRARSFRVLENAWGLLEELERSVVADSEIFELTIFWKLAFPDNCHNTSLC